MTQTLILFDVDGTLVDSQAHIVAAMDFAFEGQGMVPPKPAQTRSIIGLSLHQAMGILAPDADAATCDALVEGYKNSFASMRGQIAPSPLFPGALECLDILDQWPDTVLGIATGKSKRGLDHVLATHNLEKRFVTQQVADFHPSKPHPAMAEAAMAEAGADQGVMIGDTSFDMEMGRAAGMKTIAVTWGYHPVSVLTPLADCVIEDYAALPAAIKQLWSME